MEQRTISTASMRSTELFRHFRKDPIALLRTLAKERPGETCDFKFAGRRILLLQDPLLIEQVLVESAPSFEKGPGLLRSKAVLGDGLLTRPTAGHPERKRRLQPAFRKAQADAHVPAICEIASAWAGNVQANTPVNLHSEMMGITLRAVSETIFNSTALPETQSVAESVVTALRELYSPLVQRQNGEGRGCHHSGETAHAVERLESSLGSVLKARRPTLDPRSDFFSLLAGEQDGALSPQEIRDDAVSVYLAGHESTANCLSWTWYALSQNPNVAAEFHREIDALSNVTNFAIAAPDFTNLTYTRRILLESMRLYPPAWMLSREAREPLHLGEHALSAHDIVVAAQCVTHVDSRYYEDPMRFNPDRWLPEVSDGRPKFSYFPFGAGPRVCIGENFAYNELLTILAVVGSRWRFDVCEQTDPTPEPLVTLRPKHGMVLVPKLR